ncbi:MAG: XRE family transcriptional regulator [Verrucomicrobiaceae bacterium]|nr:MAG: XRE family transcriptional regulator [Verrucomicrobiaceae bacterium]
MSNAMSALLVDAMHRRKLTRTQVGSAVGLSPTMISMVKSGTYVLPCERVEGLADILNVPVGDLVEAGIASYPDNSGWRIMEIAMRIRLAA